MRCLPSASGDVGVRPKPRLLLAQGLTEALPAMSTLLLMTREPTSALQTARPEETEKSPLAGPNHKPAGRHSTTKRPSRRDPRPDQLQEGETVLALAVCSPRGAIEMQAANPIRIVVTDQRFLALKTSRLTGRSKGDVDFEIPLGQVHSVQTRRRHPVATVGVPVLSVAMVLLDEQAVVFETSGFGIKAMRRFVDALEAAALALPESKYETSAKSPHRP
jgi:hypothetical protein